MITRVTSIAVSIMGDISAGATASSFAQRTEIRAPTAATDSARASALFHMVACRSTHGWHATILSRAAVDTYHGQELAKNAVVCSGVLYTFHVGDDEFLT